MDVDFLDVSHLFTNVREWITFMRGRNLLVQDLFCCRQICSKVHDSNTSDKEMFQCNICKRRQSIRIRSFWSKSKLPLTILMAILYFFSQDLSVSQCKKLLNKHVSKVSIIQWYNYFRDLMTTYMARNPVRFNNNTTVHCDESFIGGKRKYNRGRVPAVTPRFVFGIIDNTAHKAVVEFVPRRDAANIIPIITRHVPPGCQINTDGANVYKQLRFMNYTHRFCIHNHRYVDPITGIHSNWIENFWANLKIKLKSLRGSQGNMLDGHLDEYLYRYNRKNDGEMFDNLLSDISNLYPV